MVGNRKPRQLSVVLLRECVHFETDISRVRNQVATQINCIPVEHFLYTEFTRSFPFFFAKMHLAYMTSNIQTLLSTSRSKVATACHFVDCKLLDHHHADKYCIMATLNHVAAYCALLLKTLCLTASMTWVAYGTGH